MLKNSTLTQLDHIFHLKSYKTLLMLVVLFCFFSEVNEKNYSPGQVGWPAWKGESAGGSCDGGDEQWGKLLWGRTMVEIPQKWQNTPSIAFNGRVGEWKQFKKNLTRLIRKSSPQELKRESYPGLLGNLLLDAHLLKFPEWAITQKKNCFSN